MDGDSILVRYLIKDSRAIDDFIVYSRPRGRKYTIIKELDSMFLFRFTVKVRLGS